MGTSPAKIPSTRVDFFGAGVRFHHVGLVASDISQAMGCEAPSGEDPQQKVRAAFADLHGCPVEILEPLTADSPVSGALKKGGKLVHLAFETDSIDGALARAIENGFRVLQPPQVAELFFPRRIAWVHHPTWGLFELLEAPVA